MRIFGIHLRNFRRFSRFTLYPNSGLTVVLGPNNSGKTALLRALDLALNPAFHSHIEELVGRFDFHRAHLATPVEIWVYLLIEDGDSHDIHARFGNRVSRWLLRTTNQLCDRPHADSGEPPFEPAIKEPMTQEPTHTESYVELLAVHFSATWLEESATVKLSWHVVNEVGNSTHFSIEDRRAIGFTLIPAHRDPLQMLGFTRRRLLGRLLDDAEISGPLRRLVEDIERLKTPLTDTESVRKALETIQTTLNELRLFEGERDVRATITFLRTEVNRLRAALELAFSTVSETEGPRRRLETGEPSLQRDSEQDSFSVPLSYQGDGVQNALLLATLSAANTAKAHSIGAIEEPERSLEPWRVKSLFKKLAAGSGSQLFVTTHSPAVLGEIKGVDTLVILIPKHVLSGEASQVEAVRVVVGRELPDAARKEFERFRDIYSRCLFARLILVVEGSSESGFLPVALAMAAKKRGGPDLSALGLELFENDRGREDMHLRAEHLTAFGKRVAILLDHDERKKGEPSTEDRLKLVAGKAEVAFIWARKAILDGARGCDLEVVLAEGTPLPSLIEALRTIYADPGHPIDPDLWGKERSRVLRAEYPLVNTVPQDFPNPTSYSFSNLDERVARLILLVLMHGPHSVKAARDMRRLAESLQGCVPGAVLKLYDRIRSLLENKREAASTPYYDLSEGTYFDLNRLI